ncbi:phage tail protein, partial [Escherichia coli]|nr:phage tail protein [Escherichia coli]
MTVSTEVDHNEYTGNGVTTSFPYTFRIFKKSDLVVQVSDLNGNVTELVLDAGYTVTGAGTYSGGAVVLPSPLAAGWRITIERVLDVVQETDLRNQGKFFPEVHEDAFDYLTMLIQRCFGWFRRALMKPSLLAKYYDAKQNRISNLADPKNSQDAVTKKYVQDLYSGVVRPDNIDNAMYVTDLANGKYDSSRLDMSVGYEIKTISNFVRINGAVYRVTPAAVGIVTEITSRYILAGGKK